MERSYSVVTAAVLAALFCTADAGAVTDGRFGVPAPAAQAATAQPARSARPVEVYMTSWCGYCKQLISFLNQKRIPYNAYDIEKDPAAAKVFEEYGGGVPLVKVGSHVVYGYNPQAILKYLNEK